MKNRRIMYPGLLIVAGLASMFFSCQTSRPGEPVSVNRNDQMVGYLYNSDGSPAKNAKVVLVASDYVPSALSKKAAMAGVSVSAASGATIDGVTDQNGRYSFATVSAGTYNIFGEGNGNVSYTSSVPVSSDKMPVAVNGDTLNKPGSIQGRIVTSPASDSRKIFILIIGGYIVRWPDDADGKFTIKNLARGKYRLRFLSANSDFPVLDTTVTVVSGQTTDIGTILLIKHTLVKLTENFLSMKFGTMVHFNMSTFDRCCCDGSDGKPTCYSVTGEWGIPNRDRKIFNPSALNCGQWADAAKAAGAKYTVLTVKHHDGFCLWPTKYTDYCISNAATTTDVVRQFVDSARSRGLQVGFYYSMRDLTNGYSMNFIKSQLTELLTNYGPITCMFFDGWGWDAGYTRVPYLEISSLVKTLQPNCILIENNHEYTQVHSEIAEYEMPIDGPPPLTNILPGEGCEPIRYSPADKERCWFWHPNGECNIMSPQMIVDRLNQCNSGNANYLLNVGPDTTGRLPQCEVECLKSVGALRGIQ